MEGLTDPSLEWIVGVPGISFLFLSNILCFLRDIRPRFLLSQAQLRLAQALLLVLVGQILADWIYIGFQQIFPRWTKKKHKMKNDPCRKSLPPGVNRFVEKGPLKPEKNKRASEASDKKVI